MTEIIKVAKWFDEYVKNDDIPGMAAKIGVCAGINSYPAYEQYNNFFKENEYREIHKNYKKYLRALLDGYEVEIEEEKTPLGWKPKNDDVYWYVGSNGDIWSYEYDNVLDERVFKYTKVFKTKEEAEFEAEKMKVTRELERYSKEFEYDVDDYCICAYKGTSNKDYRLKIEILEDAKFNDICFISEEQALKAIEAVGKDRILKYYFGVYDD